MICREKYHDTLHKHCVAHSSRNMAITETVAHWKMGCVLPTKWRERSDSFTIWLGHWFCAHHRMIVDCRSCSNVFFLPILLVVPISIHVVGLIRSGHQNSGTSFLGGCTEGVTLVY